jgi:virulence factor
MTKTGAPLRVGILGAGDILRKAYMPLLPGWPGISIVGIYNRTLQAASDVAGQWHLPFSTDNLDALLDQKMDAAFVLTSNESHFSFTKILLENGIDVYSEKPSASTSLEARQLADLAGKNDRILMIGFNRRYAPLYQQAREVMKEKKIRMCILEKHRTGVWNRGLEVAYLDDIIHQIDLLRFFTGEPVVNSTRVMVENGRFLGAESSCSLPDGGMGLVLSSREAGMWQERAFITGDDTTVQVNAFRELRILHKDHEEVYGTDRGGKWFPQLLERGFTGEIEHFFSCVETRSKPLTDGHEAALTQQLVEEMIAKSVNLPVRDS